jgi:2-polyprenyl-3-methyl-5-hydroxy-6-metoxy-1,4-benzoquinol methylase
LDGSSKLHLTNTARTQFFDTHIHRQPRLGRAKWVLEVGAGDGVVAEALALRGYKVTAVDVAVPFLQVSRHERKPHR